MDGDDSVGAVRVSQKAIALDASRWEAYVVAATAYSAHELFDDALGMLQQALVRAPEDRKSGIRDAVARVRARLANPTPSLKNPAATVGQINQWIRSIGTMKFTHVKTDAFGTTDTSNAYTYSEITGECGSGFLLSFQSTTETTMVWRLQPRHTVTTSSGQRFQLDVAAVDFRAVVSESGPVYRGEGDLMWAVRAGPMVVYNDYIAVDGKKEPLPPEIPSRMDYTSPEEVMVLRDERDARELANLWNYLHTACAR